MRHRLSWCGAVLLGGLLAMTATGSPRAAAIDCTGAAFVQAIQDACPAGNTTLTFACRDTVIEIDESWDRYDRVVACDNVTIDGEDRSITFRQTPPCEADFPDTCPDIEGGAWLMALEGNNGTVRNIRVESFWEGIHALGGTGNVVENVVFDRPCDDAFTNDEEAGASVFRNNQVTRACDKAIQINGKDIGTTADRSPTDPDYYDLQVLDNEFIDCKQPIRTTKQGRFLVARNTFRMENPQGSLFRCDGPRFSGSGLAVYFQENTVDGCRRGLRANDSATLRIVDNLFKGNLLRGVALFGNSRAVLEGNRFEGNGGSGSSEAYYGGLAVAESAQADAGGGSLTIDGQTLSSAGQNVFLGNIGADDLPLDLQNQTSSTVSAESCYWGDADPSDQVEGAVDFTPWLDAEPGDPQPPADPPAVPSNLRRTDTRPPS